MPSINESRQQVRDSLRSEQSAVDHDAVLASLQDEIDKHNGVKESLKRSMRSGKHSRDERSAHRTSGPTKFRFKDGVDEPRERRKHRHRRSEDHDGHRRSKRKRDYPTPPEDEDVGAAHPFPREPTDPARPDHSTDDSAFRESLFDALADDEGAAYWESVYSQPIHVYSRPTVQTEKGELEEMTDEQYTAYVKTKMWEKKHPEIVLERERSEKRRREEEEEKTREREDFVRRKEQAAWDKAQRRTFKSYSDDEAEEGGDGRRYEYEFAGEKEWSTPAPSGGRAQRQEFADAWSRYLAAWDRLKHELLEERQKGTDPPRPVIKALERIPWPVLASKPAIKANIEDFMRHAPADKERTVVHVLKAERVRWHPDKVQQRFGGEVDEGTMNIVTGVFQVIDGLLEEERKRTS